MPVEGGESRNLTRAFDQDIGKNPSCDVRVASPDSNPQWSADAEAIYFTSTYGGVVRLYKVPSGGGEVEPALGGVDHGIEAWSMSGSGVIAYTTLETTAPIELWVKGDGKPRRITDFNSRWTKGINLCSHERFEFRSSAGHTVEVWLMRPPGFREGDRYPIVLEIHGVPTELVRFPGENHDLSRSGKPKHREQRLNHIIRWFKTYL